MFVTIKSKLILMSIFSLLGLLTLSFTNFVQEIKPSTQSIYDINIVSIDNESIDLGQFKGKKILLPDHVGSRIFNDLSGLNYDVMILPDREWIQLSNKIKIQCITNHLQDSVLLIDVCGKLFINLNDAGVKGCSNYIKK